MSPNQNTIYLITGANRGIGRGLASAYLKRPSHTVIAAVRDPQHSTSLSLASLPTHSSSTLIVVKIDSLVETDPQTAISTLTSPPHSLTHIDTVIANAGVLTANRVQDISAAEYLLHQSVNVVGPMLLFQAAWPLLEKAETPKFVVVSSTLGSVAIGPTTGVPSGSYGASKAALNYLVRKLHFEHERLVALPICPGMTQTDMGDAVAKVLGREKANVELDDSIKGVVEEIDNANRTKAGRFASYNHADVMW